MTTGEKILMWVLIFLAFIGFYFIGTAQGWWRNIFSSKPSTTPEKSDLEKCTEANKSKADGEPCSNCVAEGSGAPNFNGIIRNGVCSPKAEPAPAPAIRRYIVSNANGAIIYTLQGNNFVAPAVPNKVQAGTQIIILAVSPNRDYVNTSFGWLSINDIGAL